MELIRSIEELTPDVMTTVMRSSGALGDDAEVAGVDAVGFGEEAGLLSVLYRVSLSYAGGSGGPKTAVVKFPTDDPGQRGIADALGLFNRECMFYNVVAESAPFQTPAIYGLAQAEDSTDFVIIMEDLGYMERIDQVAGASLAESETALSALARLHAHYWDHEDLDTLGQTLLPMDNPVYHAALPEVFGGGWAALNEQAPELVDPRVREFGDSYAAHLPNMLAALNTPQTLLHGDYRSDNLLLDSEGNLAVIDFQITGVGNCAFDIAYFLSSSVSTELRNEHQEHLLRLYHETLTANGVDHSFDDLMEGIRIALNFCLIYGVASFVGWDSFGERQQDLMRAICARTIASIVDADALASLPSL